MNKIPMFNVVIELSALNRNIITQISRREEIQLSTAEGLFRELVTLSENPCTLEEAARIERILNNILNTRIIITRIKRKYTRRVVENVIEPIIEVIPVKKMYGFPFPIGTIVRTQKGNNLHNYEITDVVDQRNVMLSHVDTKSSFTHSLQSVVDCVLSRGWELVNPSPESIALVNNYTNVAKHTTFKNIMASSNTSTHQIFGEGFVMPINNSNNPFFIPVTPGFTGNCQLSIIGHMSTLVSKTTNLNDQLKEITNKTSRKLLLCDVRNEVIALIEKELPSAAIHSKMSYTSTNGSRMVILLINLKKLR